MRKCESFQFYPFYFHLPVWSNDMNQKYKMHILNSVNSSINLGIRCNFDLNHPVAIAYFPFGNLNTFCMHGLTKKQPIKRLVLGVLRHELSPWHELSPATIHAGNIAYVIDITGDNSCRMKKIIGIHCRRRHILTPSRPIFIYIFFLSNYCFFFIWLRFQMGFLRYSSYTNLSNKNNPQNILYDDINVNI